ncbi:hypothetical protein CRG98_034756 [Punica granatum]|uniref:RNase H type-1 domain-containing protein n=1 Tax=Punica granatum TaxID=22663 RepID=A0A2I0ILD1_PUNGR|nr:hypothetical protein CRG98_034756 [Punica granatum]
MDLILLPHIVDMIKGIPLGQSSTTYDAIIWGYTQDGCYSFKSDYSLLIGKQICLCGDIPNFVTQLAAEFYATKQNPPTKTRKEIIVGWAAPPMDFNKLNTNGSSISNRVPAGAGGLIQDPNGCWIRGFSTNIGTATSVVAELASPGAEISSRFRNQ